MKTGIFLIPILYMAAIACKQSAQYRTETRQTAVALGNMDSIKTMNGIGLSPDQKKLYTSWIISRNKNQKGKYQTRIYEHENINGVFGAGKLISFSNKYIDYHPVLSPNGKKMFFNSLRPLPGDTAELAKNNIWVSEFKNGTWQEPEPALQNSNGYGDSYPTVARNGNLYFTSSRPGSKARDIYVSVFQNGRYHPPLPISEINSDDDENDVTVDAGERFLIFNVYRFSTKQIDMFIAYKQQNGWGTPLLLNKVIGAENGDWNLTPGISPDGKWFLFERNFRIKKIPIDSIVKK